jgi:uncharacterized protein
MTRRPPSPCQNICALDPSASICTGCGRTIAEIAEWGLATASRQHDIVRRSSARLRILGSQLAKDSEPPSASKGSFLFHRNSAFGCACLRGFVSFVLNAGYA